MLELLLYNACQEALLFSSCSGKAAAVPHVGFFWNFSFHLGNLHHTVEDCKACSTDIVLKTQNKRNNTVGLYLILCLRNTAFKS